MTDRYHSLTVVLDRDVRDDDAEHLINAIGQLRGVISVAGNVASSESFMAQERARVALTAKIWDALK